MNVLVRRLIQLIVVLVVVTFFTSILTALLPGDPVTTIAPFSSEQDRANIRNQLNLNENIVVRYGKWLGHFVTGDMGREYAGTGVRGQSIWGRIKDSLPRSLLLMLYVQILTLLIAVPLGVDHRVPGGLPYRRLIERLRVLAAEHPRLRDRDADAAVPQRAASPVTDRGLGRARDRVRCRTSSISRCRCSRSRSGRSRCTRACCAATWSRRCRRTTS